MERVAGKEMRPGTVRGIEVSLEPQLCALSEQYAGRGLAAAVKRTAEEQAFAESETCKLSPEAYRLSSVSEAAMIVKYRRGKEHMSSSDLLSYFSEVRGAHLTLASLDGNTGVDKCGEEAGASEETAVAVSEPAAVPSHLAIKKRLGEAWPTWFDASAPDTSSNRRRFPLSALAAMVAVAVSLLLIVASSVMIRLAESDVSRLKDEISNASVEAGELKSDFEVQNDLLQIRRIATEEYGMVSEEYVKMDYISLGTEDSVEIYPEQREARMTLSALLSAIGIR